LKNVYTGLVGDIGGTHARLALVDEEGHIRHPVTYDERNYPSLTEVIATYLEKTLGRKRPERAVLAVAGPVVDGEIQFTNNSWRASEGELFVAFEFESVRLINDFAAQALAAQRLAEATAAGQKPQVSWLGGVNASRGNGHRADFIGGVQVSVPLWRATDEPQLSAARRRAEAASVQRDETLEAKSWRLTEIHDAAGNSLDRARRIAEMLRSSQQVRSATLQQWQQLGRRSLFDVMGAEADYYGLRVAQINALYDAQQAVAVMGSMGRGVTALLR
jgi:hypothetical protein